MLFERFEILPVLQTLILKAFEGLPFKSTVNSSFKQSKSVLI